MPCISTPGTSYSGRGSIPITCSDNETAKEFLPEDFICSPETDSIINQIKLIDKNYDEKRKLAFKLGEKYKKQFNKNNIAQNILNIKNDLCFIKYNSFKN